MVNPYSGLWEVQIMTTKSIRVLPEMMGKRAAQTNLQKKNSEEDVVYADDSGLDETSNSGYEEDDEDEDDEWW